MCKKKGKVVRLYICHECYDRIGENKGFTRYRGRLYCDKCFIDNLDKFDLSEYTEREILVEEIDEYNFTSGTISS